MFDPVFNHNYAGIEWVDIRGGREDKPFLATLIVTPDNDLLCEITVPLADGLRLNGIIRRNALPLVPYADDQSNEYSVQIPFSDMPILQIVHKIYAVFGKAYNTTPPEYNVRFGTFDTPARWRVASVIDHRLQRHDLITIGLPGVQERFFGADWADTFVHSLRKDTVLCHNAWLLPASARQSDRVRILLTAEASGMFIDTLKHLLRQFPPMLGLPYQR